MRRKTPAERFIGAILIDPETGCHNWQLYCTKDGYGRTRGPGRQVTGAHRVAYELARGPIPDGLVIDHLCRNRRCVNPDHMEPVTIRENTHRGVGLAVKFAARSHCKYGHAYTPENTRIGAEGQRRCCACRSRESLVAYAAKKARA